MVDLNKALLDPTAVFTHPRDLMAEESLSTMEKVEVLKRWEYDARELEVAEEENMRGGKPSLLPAVLTALQELGHGDDSEFTIPTKHG